jgi:CO/xanthine dehydrogenase Mo-binding subunit
MFLCGPYYIPNILIEAHCVFTNKPVSSAMRGYTITNGQLCADVMMEKAAEKLGIDRFEIRMINAFRDGDMGASRYPVNGAGALETIRHTAELAGYKLPDKLMQMSSKGR